MSSLSDKLTRKRELARHLRELGLLVGRLVHETELLSLEKTKEVRAHANQVARQPLAAFEMAFAETKGPRFKVFLERLAEANPSYVYLWTPASNLCGVLRPIPLSALRMAFPFEVNPEGILVILTSDLRDQLLLDYSYGDNGEQRLEVEVSGERWGQVAY